MGSGVSVAGGEGGGNGGDGIDLSEMFGSSVGDGGAFGGGGGGGGIRDNRKAVLFKHCGYRGYSWSIPRTGGYTTKDMQTAGVRNDDLSSAIVTPGYVLTLYEHDNFQGRSRRLTSNHGCFVHNGFNDVVSSVVLEEDRSASKDAPGAHGLGGRGGGGHGGGHASNGSDAVDGSGAGGGGSGGFADSYAKGTGGDGGSGIVILRYPLGSTLSDDMSRVSGADWSYDVDDGRARVYVFEDSGELGVRGDAELDVCVVGAGGGGGHHGYNSWAGGGGGGAGEVRMGKIRHMGVKSYDVRVGEGGKRGRTGGRSSAGAGRRGGDSSAFGMTAKGGGGGGNHYGPSGRRNGGSGGGGGYNGGRGSAETGGKGMYDHLGTDGGKGGSRAGGGGGGARAGGEAGKGGKGGDGGAGFDASRVFGTVVGHEGWFASGGGGGSRSMHAAGKSSKGGGGHGGNRSGPGNSGKSGTGGGGGGGNRRGPPGDGGSGVVLVRLPILAATRESSGQEGALDSVALNGREPVAAYALRRLFGNYNGPQVRARRSSDDSEADVYFDAGGRVVDVRDDTGMTTTPDLGTWLSRTDAYAVKWYDQSPRALHLSQRSRSAQLFLITAPGGKCALFNDRKKRRFDFGTLASHGITSLDFTAIVQCKPYDTDGSMSGHVFSSGRGGAMSHFFPDGSNKRIKIREHLGISESGDWRNSNDMSFPYDGRFFTYSIQSDKEDGVSRFYANDMRVVANHSNRHAFRAFDERYGVGSDYHSYIDQTSYFGEFSDLILFDVSIPTRQIREISDTFSESRPLYELSANIMFACGFFRIVPDSFGPFAKITKDANGTPFVEAWYDQSKNGLHATPRRTSIHGSGRIRGTPIQSAPTLGGGRDFVTFHGTTDPVDGLITKDSDMFNQLHSDFSFAITFRPRQASSSDGRDNGIMWKVSTFGTNKDNFALRLNNGKLGMSTEKQSNDVDRGVDVMEYVEDRWYTLVMTWDADNRVNIFVDGQKRVSDYKPFDGKPYHGSAGLQIGYNTHGGVAFNGDIASVVLVDRALTDVEANRVVSYLAHNSDKS